MLQLWSMVAIALSPGPSIVAQAGREPGTWRHTFYIMFSERRRSTCKLQPAFQIIPPTPNLETSYSVLLTSECTISHCRWTGYRYSNRQTRFVLETNIFGAGHESVCAGNEHFSVGDEHVENARLNFSHTHCDTASVTSVVWPARPLEKGLAGEITTSDFSTELMSSSPPKMCTFTLRRFKSYVDAQWRLSKPNL